MRDVKQAKIRSSEAGRIIPELMRLGLVDRSAKIGKEEDFRLVPIADGKVQEVLSMGYEVTEGPAHTLDRESPQVRIIERLSHIPSDIIDGLPMRWEMFGDIAILKLGSVCIGYEKDIGEAYAEILGVKSVCADIEGVVGEYRQPTMRLLFGDSTESVKLEGGIKYELDVTKIMYASGNVEERQRMGELDCKGETVVDMFAGIGYFTLPIAKFSGAEKVIACEKNPDSHHYLLRNISANDVSEKVFPMLGDNRDIPGTGIADRIIMGYVQRTSEFLPKALSMIRGGGVIHYHDTFYTSEGRDAVDSIFYNECGDGYVIERFAEVKSFAPSVSHFVADVRIL